MIKRLAYTVLGFAMLFGCARHVKPQPPLRGPVNKQNYAWVETEPNLFLVVARNHEAATKAMKEIGCGPCAVQFDEDRQIMVVRMLK